MANRKVSGGNQHIKRQPFCKRRACPGCLETHIQLLAKASRGSEVFTAARVLSGKSSSSIGVAAVGVDKNVRSILRRIFTATTEFRSAGFFDTSTDAVRMISAREVQAAVIELNLTDSCGILCARELMALWPRLRTILITTLRDPAFCERAAAVGIREFSLKPLRFSQFLATLRFVTSGMKPGSQAMLKAVLTSREEDVLRCLAEGMLYKEIENKLDLSHAVIRRLQYRIFKKLHAQNRTEAVINWHRSRIG